MSNVANRPITQDEADLLASLENLAISGPNQAIAKTGSTSVANVDLSGPATIAWGSITGNIADQIDLNQTLTSAIQTQINSKPKVIFDHYADVGNVGIGEDDLYSDTLSAGILAINGDKITASYQGIFVGAAASTQDLRVYFAGTKIYDSGALSIGAATDNWTIEVVIIRESSTVVRCSVALSTDFGTLFPYSAYTRITGLTLSNSQILKLTGESGGVGAADNQIIAKLGYVEWKSAA